MEHEVYDWRDDMGYNARPDPDAARNIQNYLRPKPKKTTSVERKAGDSSTFQLSLEEQLRSAPIHTFQSIAEIVLKPFRSQRVPTVNDLKPRICELRKLRYFADLTIDGLREDAAWDTVFNPLYNLIAKIATFRCPALLNEEYWRGK